MCNNFFFDIFIDWPLNIIYTLHPLHLVCCFEVFSNTCFFGVFFYEPRKKILCLFFDVCEVGMEFAGSEQIVIQDFVVLFQVS